MSAGQQPQPSHRDIVEAFTAVLGSKGAMALWAAITEIQAENKRELELLRQLKAKWRDGDPQAVTVLFGMLLSWDESETRSTYMAIHAPAMREASTFAVAQAFADKHRDDVLGQRVSDSIKVLRALFARLDSPAASTAVM